MRYTKFFLTVFLIITGSFAYSQTSCSILKHVKLKYVDCPDKSTYILINGEQSIEYYNNEKYYIKSKIKWVHDCEYIMTMTDITLPNFPFHPGDVMDVTVENIDNDVVTYSAIVNNNTNTIYKGQMRIVR
jgi:hypothetical protein